MLNEKLEEIMEAIWSAGENKKFSAEAIQKKCIVDFTTDDLKDLEQKGLIRKKSRYYLHVAYEEIAPDVKMRFNEKNNEKNKNKQVFFLHLETQQIKRFLLKAVFLSCCRFSLKCLMN